MPDLLTHTIAPIASDTGNSAVLAGAPTSTVALDDTNHHSVELKITLEQVANLNRAKCKDAGWSMVARVIILNTEYGVESSKTQVTTLLHNVNQKLSTSLKFHAVQDLEELLYYPLLVNFYEIITVVKDKKKQAEEKFELIGQCAIDLQPFFKGELEIRGKWQIYNTTLPDPKADAAALQLAAAEPPECHLSLTLTKPLIPPAFQQIMNILTVDLLGVFGMPEQWLAAAGTKAVSSVGFTIVTAIPKNGIHERYLVSSGRSIISKPSTQFQKRWPAHPSIVSDAIFRTDFYTLPEKRYFAETGAMTEPKDWQTRHSMEHNKAFLPICTEFRCVLSEDAAESLIKSTKKTKVLPVELFELTHPEKHPGTKKKGVVESAAGVLDDLQITRHGAVFINVKPIFYPDKLDVLGAFPVVKFDSQDMMDRANRTSLGADVIKTAALLAPRPVGEKDGRISIISKKAVETEYHPYQPPKSTVTDAAAVASAAEAELKLFDDSKTYLYAELSILRPLIHDSDSKTNLAKVKEVVTPPPLGEPDQKEAAEKAEKAVRKHIEGILVMIKEKYACQVGAGDSATKPTHDELLADLERDLTATGDFHAIKEQFKLHLIHLVRDKYGRTRMPDDPNEFDDFLSTVYDDLFKNSVDVYRLLLQRCHLWPTDQKRPVSIDSLRVLTIEAELDRNRKMAEEHFVKRTKIAPKNVDVWRDLGNFYLRWKKFDLAEAAFKEILLDNYIDHDGLLLLGNVFLESGQYATATAFFESVRVIYPDSPFGWVVLGLFYEIIPHGESDHLDILVEYAFHRANQAMGAADKRKERYEEFLKALETEKIQAVAAPTMADTIKLPTVGHIPASARADTENRGASRNVQKKENKLMSAGGQDTSLQREAQKLEPVFTHLLAPPTPKIKPPEPVDNIFWCCIAQLTSLGLYQMTLQCVGHLENVVAVDDPVYWQAVVMTLIDQQKLDEAAKWLDKVKLLDVETADIFALYGYVNYQRGQLEAAAHDYKRALRLISPVSDPFQLYYCYGRICEKFKQHQKAAEMFNRAAACYSTCETWLGCGRALFHLEDFASAELALQAANQIDCLHPVVWAYLSMVAVKKGLIATAERCADLAVQFGVEEVEDVYLLMKHFRC